MIFQRRTDTERHVVGGMNDTMHRYYDETNERTVVKLFTGGCYVTAEHGEMIVTILGSCIAACIRDPQAVVGGMNHFLLPGGSEEESQSMRFGSFSMEQLINELLKKGAKKERLEIKLFGGGNVMSGLSDVGARNIRFAREFLKTEGLRIAAEDLGDIHPRRVHYFPDTGKVMLRKLRRRDDDVAVAAEEKNYMKSLIAKPTSGEVELFS